MGNYITDLPASHDEAQVQKLKSEGFNKINADLGKWSGERSIYLWYKKENFPAILITRVQVTYNKRMESGLFQAGYRKITGDPIAEAKGDDINIWVLAGSTDYNIPIVDFDITADARSAAQKFCDGWERVGCNLQRRAVGNWADIWVKRQMQTYICDVSATNSYGSDADYYKEGYIKMDKDCNWCAGGSDVFIW